MDANNVCIRTPSYRCFYFCPGFYKVYCKIQSTCKVYVKFKGSEAIFCCGRCLQEVSLRFFKMKKYVKGTISLYHCRGHHCLIVLFYFDGF